ncbi:hypothetical protein [Paracoccus alkenifer]|uniref:Uncharacterized protein n=1 Tax=Paracoccus alkenifer TaxID=65735 RepID=A0A1H6NHT2_9RHOB|nr:hypothetical protein [Paracoccus alkenifer]SEI10132.1 hypothetical protein SAMN04488075_2872 [Paracoccus alkenifer]
MSDRREQPPLTAEAFDAMMADVQAARLCLAGLLSDTGHDRNLAARLSAEILSIQSAIESRAAYKKVVQPFSTPIRVVVGPPGSRFFAGDGWAFYEDLIPSACAATAKAR